MIYWDVLHGTIDLARSDHGGLLRALLATPEMQRLRNMRLMNFDVPHIQDLSSTRRLPHAIGTCHLASLLAEHSDLATTTTQAFLASSLIHDIGILPYGHLVETFLRKKSPGFSHEKLVRKIIHGTYHPTNRYHQILPGKSLQIATTLRKHGVELDEAADWVVSKAGTAVSSDLDVDNIDNVHRMAILLGYADVRENVDQLVKNAWVDSEKRLIFLPEALDAILCWLNLRENIYSRIIAHPDCVAYNAWATDLVRLAIDNDIITEDTWFISEREFEKRLLAHSATKTLALQIEQGCSYRLIDYVWLRATGEPPYPAWSQVDKRFDARLAPPPRGMRYFYWVESTLLSRTVAVNLAGAPAPVEVGSDSCSILIALVRESEDTDGSLLRLEKQPRWRSMVVDTVRDLLSGWTHECYYPETYETRTRRLAESGEQLDLFQSSPGFD